MSGLPDNTIIPCGGMLGIFRNIGCVGDSLSSGEFEFDNNGELGYWDCYEYSWGKMIERLTGVDVTNFSRGGMTAYSIYTEADEKNSVTESINRLFDKDNAKQAYIIALGVNDLHNIDMECYGGNVGGAGDIKEDYRENANTVIGWYGKIIARLKEISPHAKFFLLTIPDNGKNEKNAEAFAKALRDTAKKLKNCYIVDLYKDAPCYCDDFRKAYFNGGHMNAMGYLFTAHYVMRYIDDIIRKNHDDFRYVQFSCSGKKPYLYD
ncbi:MAG TPA: SGNH/GDSL hydrolase family protein [Candidatus Ornithomonoglobus intestinigallinarum]|uniref:SGNH/GDSL hydrolase family protein n=1 Tax=Candidatus Ornithomonoglobus intestinigallinarum TaxID=2840894 RepID=A0A9D1H4M1_9FIRM|nr:SGNH/GDSL hydrolase family protein [Candidatus Ornithomonoglobus intestinigallinarum]